MAFLRGAVCYQLSATGSIAVLRIRAVAGATPQGSANAKIFEASA